MPNISKIYLEGSIPKCLKFSIKLVGLKMNFLLHMCEEVFTEGWDDEMDLNLSSKEFHLAQRKHLAHAFSLRGLLWDLKIGVSLSEAWSHTGQLTV